MFFEHLLKHRFHKGALGGKIMQHAALAQPCFPRDRLNRYMCGTVANGDGPRRRENTRA